MKIKAWRFYEFGGPSVLEWEEMELPGPGPGQALVRHTAIGVNFAEIYARKGQTHAPDHFPAGLGLEAAGVVEAVGRGVKFVKPGQRVAYAGNANPGAYAEACLHDADTLIKLPRWIDDKTAAAAMTKGMTTQYLFNRTHKLKAGDTILMHAAAGGVGQIAGQWAKAVGARIIGTVSTPEKARIAKRSGYTHVITRQGRPGKRQCRKVVEEVMRLTNGRGVNVVYDSTGKDTWSESAECVERLGLVVLFGAASGAPEPMDFLTEGSKKSAYFHRATSVNYHTSPEIRQKTARHLLRMMKSGAVKIKIGQTYPLSQARKVHRDLAARKTTGSTVMIPDT
ncbi:MAG: quinone oxidoreductase [Rhodospirillales bacterium]|jgi:NADPH2:quinone reductase|nr:quinone oxidoreductase [Rhodospirillales bacterium]